MMIVVDGEDDDDEVYVVDDDDDDDDDDEWIFYLRLSVFLSYIIFKRIKWPILYHVAKMYNTN